MRGTTDVLKSSIYAAPRLIPEKPVSLAGLVRLPSSGASRGAKCRIPKN